MFIPEIGAAAMTTPTAPVFPVIPPTPSPGAQWEIWDQYLKAVASFNEALWIQRDIEQDAEHLRKAELVFEMMKVHPEVTGVTDLGLVDFCIKRVEAFMTRFPTE